MLRDLGASGGAGRDWLQRRTAKDWIRAGLAELARAERALAAHQRTAGVLGLRRAAGMALNGALSVCWKDWGRTYVEHLRALPGDADVPEPVREAARLLNGIELETAPKVVRLTPPSEGAGWVEAARTVMAHAYAVVYGSAGRGS